MSNTTPGRDTSSIFTPTFPPLPPPADQSTFSIVQLLLNPEEELYIEDGAQVKLTLVWAIGKIGVEQFEYPEAEMGGRRVLRQDSKLRLEGIQAGLPQEIMDWLCGEVSQGEVAQEELILPKEKFIVVQ